MKTKLTIFVVSVMTIMSCKMEKTNCHSRNYKNPIPLHQGPAKTKGGPNSSNFYNR